MEINLRDVLTNEGYREDFSLIENLSELFNDVEEYKIVSDVECKGYYTATRGVAGISGFIKLTYRGYCARCVTEVDKKMDILFSEKIFPLTHKTDVYDNEEAEYTYEGKKAVIDKMVRDLVILNFPMTVLCKKNCKGVCSICGIDLNKESCSCLSNSVEADSTDSTFDVDPRLAKLKDYFKN